jgi:hypothetical protein
MQESRLGKGRGKGRSGIVTGVDRNIVLACLLSHGPGIQTVFIRTVHLPVLPYTTNQNGGSWWRTYPDASHEQGI